MSKIWDIFKKILGVKDLPEEKTKTLDNRETLRRNILVTLSELIEDTATTEGRRLVIWLDCANNFIFEQYDNKDYGRQILCDLANQKGFGFEQVTFRKGKPGEVPDTVKIGDNDLEYLKVEEYVVPLSAPRKAVIRFYGGLVSPVQAEYVLSSEEISSGRIPAYNIGRGSFTHKAGVFRQNHIVFDDNPDSPLREHNRCISRNHAHIGFDKSKGFTFQVDEGGATPGKTILIKGERQIDCDCIYTPPFSLQDGDKIIVKNGEEIEFVLVFNELNN